MMMMIIIIIIKNREKKHVKELNEEYSKSVYILLLKNTSGCLSLEIENKKPRNGFVLVLFVVHASHHLYLSILRTQPCLGFHKIIFYTMAMAIYSYFSPTHHQQQAIVSYFSLFVFFQFPYLSLYNLIHSFIELPNWS